MKEKNSEEIKALIKKLMQNEASSQELINMINDVRRDELPLELLLITKLSNLEAIVKYLRENQNLSYKEIGTKLNRNSMTLAVTYKNAKEKMPEPIELEIKNTVPFSAFQNDLSIMESIVFYLSKQGLKQIQISKITGKDPRTIWTMLNRAQTKIKK